MLSHIFITEIGGLYLQEEAGRLTRLTFLAAEEAGGRLTEASSPLLKETERQIRAYFSGSLRRFDLPLAPKGTPFMQNVWQALERIPFGVTASYADIACAIGRPKACRAVGMANNKNPIAIVIPCHRVIGRDNKLVGYGGGLHIKQRLLRLEGVLL